MRNSADQLESRRENDGTGSPFAVDLGRTGSAPAIDSLGELPPWWRHRVGPLLGAGIDAVMRCCCRIEVYGAEHLRHAPGALVISNHRRDTDGPIVGGILIQRSGLRLHGVRPYFVAREDLFRRGFLLQYLEGWPRPLRRLLGALALDPVLRSIQLLPMRRVRERSLIEVLEDALQVLGDRPLEEIVRPEVALRLQRQLLAGRQPLTLSAALAAHGPLLYERNAFRKLTLAALRALKPFERRVIETQLNRFVGLLEAGETVLLEPEGTISMDGTFMRPRRALHALVNGPSRPPPVLPVALSYDFMTPRRPRVLVRFGGARADLAGLTRRDTDRQVKETLLGQCMLTASQLTGRFMRECVRRGRDTLTAETLERYLAAGAECCADAGIPVDPSLLDRNGRRRRARECLNFCCARGIVRRERRRLWRLLPDRCHEQASRFRADGIVGYLNNELDAIASVRPGLLAEVDV